MTRARRAGFAAAALIAALILAGLGVWQVERRAWKHELIAAVEARLDAAPVAVGSGYGGVTRYREMALDPLMATAALSTAPSASEAASRPNRIGSFIPRDHAWIVIYAGALGRLGITTRDGGCPSTVHRRWRLPRLIRLASAF